jgi:import inner membrane translocase subunit TIM17
MARREPCPGRIFDDLGGAFAMGCIGGCVFYFAKGFLNAPSRERLKGAILAVKYRAPILGGSFAMWGGLFSSFDCALLHKRRKDDYVNAILAGGFTGGLLAIRAGPKVAGRNAVVGALILAVIEGVNAGYTNIMVRQQMLMMQEVSKLQEERMQRQMQGLPDFTREEIEARMVAKNESEPGFFKRLFTNPN